MEARLNGDDDLLPAGGGYGGVYGGGGHNRGGGGGGGAPWDLVAAAGAALPLGHPQGLGGGGGKGDKGGGGGNAEITPLQVDPSVTFDTVGGLEHYIKVRTVRPMPACVCVSPAPV